MFNRLLLFLGLLGIMIVLAGVVFSRTENPANAAHAKTNPTVQTQTRLAVPQDTLGSRAAGDSILETAQKATH